MGTNLREIIDCGARARTMAVCAWVGFACACSTSESDSSRRNALEPDASPALHEPDASPEAGKNRQTSETGSDAAVDADSFFELSHRIEVELELLPEDWAALREEGRSMEQLLQPGGVFEYTFFDASVTIDGVSYEQVQVRKKGFLGSLSALRPSLKIDLNRVVDTQNHLGIENITLNNDRQDPSHTHQCMAYRLFAAAGLPASRCNLAHVVVNGEDLGTYSNVEPIRKPLLARHFGDHDGDLYEGQAADFVDGSIERLEKKNNTSTDDRSNAHALADALEVADDELVEALSTELDLDHFRDFWAMETLIGHWDGYAGNTNNYYVYRDPSQDRFVFLPWGVDSAFEGLNPFDTVNQDITVYAAGLIPNRLYGLPEQRERFRTRLGELLDEVWDVDSLLEHVELVERLAPDATPAALAKQRAHIESHPQRLRDALAEPARDWQDDSGAFTSPCLGMNSDITGAFNTTFGDLNDLSPGEHELELSIDGEPVAMTWLASAGVDLSQDDNAHVRFLTTLPDGRVLVADFAIPPARFNPGMRRFHGLETAGTLLTLDSSGFTLIGLVGDGALNLDEAETESGAAVVGTLEGRFVQFACVDL